MWNLCSVGTQARELNPMELASLEHELPLGQGVHAMTW
jgi:hypothetical protein